jgi:hypothetical protein
MSDDELDKIFATVQSGHQVEGWGGRHTDDIDIPRRFTPNPSLWVRRAPNGSWVELPPMGSRHAQGS